MKIILFPYLWSDGTASECPEEESVPETDCWETTLLLIEIPDYFRTKPTTLSAIVIN